MSIEKQEEITLELTNYCPFHCRYCSVNSTRNKIDATFLSPMKIKEILGNNYYKRIIISGGEPLSHPHFYEIYMFCKDKTDDIIVHTNIFTHIMYNANVIDGIYLEANLTPTRDTQKIRILKRIDQGREKERPEVVFSRNFTEDCKCNKHVVKPNGDIVKSPCRKHELV